MGERDKERVLLMGCPVDRLTTGETLSLCKNWIAGARCSHILVGINANNYVLAQKNKELSEAVSNADLIQADGVSIVWASRLMGMRIRERVNGTDLMNRLIEEADQRKLRIYFLGTKEMVLQRMLSTLKERYKGLRIAGFHNGYFEADEETYIIEEIRKSQADILLVGMPTPFKEVWCYKNRDKLDTPVILGVGGSFDVLAGIIKRAPSWMQKSGLEWVWRLIMEPRRMWKRYLTYNTLFLFALSKYLIRSKRADIHKPSRSRIIAP